MFKMEKTIAFYIILFCDLCGSSDIFHENSKIVFYANERSDYFGYSVILRNSSIIVGAPKALNSTGKVFQCDIQLNRVNSTCEPLNVGQKVFIYEDIWVGATIATFDDHLLVCAPRYKNYAIKNHILVNGACVIEHGRGAKLFPLQEKGSQAYISDGSRPVFGAYGTHLSYFAYGMAGMAVKVTPDHRILLGAPGLLQWAGGVIEYRIRFNLVYMRSPVMNPYTCEELEPDNYFGYSVDAGVFELNGPVLNIAGAPRALSGFGKVLIFKLHFGKTVIEVIKILSGNQLGSYFGATLCSVDINGDGRSDLLVGAPNYVVKQNDDHHPYDQGGVFVYMTVPMGDGGFNLESGTTLGSGYVLGSGASGARFGTSIADLGDIDEDGYRDVAIGAPFENEGRGVVYIYKGRSNGLESKYSQRITAEEGRGFGMSIYGGVDTDKNECNDLAIGAHDSGTVYLYRCVPTVKVTSSIRIPEATDLPHNATEFSAVFCVVADPAPKWSHYTIHLVATISVDPGNDRARIAGESQFEVKVNPGQTVCQEHVIEIKFPADLSKPIALYFDMSEDSSIDTSKTFPHNKARLSRSSYLHDSVEIQLTRDCGSDKICMPSLKMLLLTLDDPYIPGTGTKLGAILHVVNLGEPAYGAKVVLHLQLKPKRVPSVCSLRDSIMTCGLPMPLHRNEDITFEIELEYNPVIMYDETLVIAAELHHPLSDERITQTITVGVKPEAHINMHGMSLPNDTLTVARDKLPNDHIIFSHYFVISNFGPSDWYNLHGYIRISDKVSLQNEIKSCSANSTSENSTILFCEWYLSANSSVPVLLNLRYDLKKYGSLLEAASMMNITTQFLTVGQEAINLNTTTVLILEPATPIWPMVLGSVVGLLVLGIMYYGLYKYGFFSRKRQTHLQEEDEDIEPHASASSNSDHLKCGDGNESFRELISIDSDTD